MISEESSKEGGMGSCLRVVQARKQQTDYKA